MMRTSESGHWLPSNRTLPTRDFHLRRRTRRARGIRRRPARRHRCRSHAAACARPVAQHLPHGVGQPFDHACSVFTGTARPSHDYTSKSAERAGLADAWHVLGGIDAGARGHRNRPHAAGGDLRPGNRRRRDQQVEPPSDQVGERILAIGYVDEVDPGRDLEQFAREMLSGADARCAEREAVRPALSGIQQVAHGLERRFAPTTTISEVCTAVATKA